MDMQIPEDELIAAGTAEPTISLPRAVLNCMLRLLLATLPAAAPDIAAENAETARAMFLALRPRDAAQAAAAVRSVAAHFASLDLHARASRPGLSDATARSLRTSANACALTAEAAARPFNKPERKPAATPPPETPRRPIPKIDQFQPRDRFGQPIPRGWAERMTMAQRRATYASPRNPELDAIAIAEEEAMIAEQKALEAKQELATTEADSAG